MIAAPGAAGAKRPRTPVRATPGPAPMGFMVPAGTAIRFHLDQQLSSADSKTGQPFTFTLLDPILISPVYTIRRGTRGAGTLILAGHAGTGGHEGDLTLQLLSVRVSARTKLRLDNQRIEVNGKNEKVAAGVLGFVPYVGLGAHFIRGADITIPTNVPVRTILTSPATVTSADATPVPAPTPSPEPSPTASS
jgi:hypothetical protein